MPHYDERPGTIHHVPEGASLPDYAKGLKQAGDGIDRIRELLGCAINCTLAQIDRVRYAVDRVAGPEASSPAPSALPQAQESYEQRSIYNLLDELAHQQSVLDHQLSRLREQLP